MVWMEREVMFPKIRADTIATIYARGYLLGILVLALWIRIVFRSFINTIGLSVATDVKINLHILLLDHLTTRPVIFNKKIQYGETVHL
ncbi:hypothetical protein [Cytobacillus purgationiresistens]|uniref:Uncharacterized protein n=1 Tax=Cytobacillus purgationiresistens TaxID=863449 RepID=A0ABU0ALP5_9BACI|nr:hypothetical protein [Cytobacillus purgationiresistens]MDQ0272162.1 hypothetical protein [Cytobacillus purgationiresistens]